MVNAATVFTKERNRELTATKLSTCSEPSPTSTPSRDDDEDDVTFTGNSTLSRKIERALRVVLPSTSAARSSQNAYDANDPSSSSASHVGTSQYSHVVSLVQHHGPYRVPRPRAPFRHAARSPPVPSRPSRVTHAAPETPCRASPSYSNPRPRRVVVSRGNASKYAHGLDPSSLAVVVAA
ncbi:hypothetical protein BE221DRAFT_192995, partial [Ostreococcus tauri]